MTARYSNPQEQTLAAALKAQAEASSPTYSPLLHERIMQGVRSSAPMPELRQQHRPRWVWWLGPLAAAAALIALAVWLWPQPKPPQIVTTTPASLPSFDPLVQKAAVMRDQIESELTQAQLAYLDHDVTKLARFLITQMNVLPTLHPAPPGRLSPSPPGREPG